MSRLNFHTYLAGCRDLLGQPLAKVFVMGNEAADLDSMVSSLAMAWLLASRHVVIPVMPIPRADFALRGEAVYVFARVGLDPEAIIFVDEVDLAENLAADGSLVLVDHNKSALSQRYSKKVAAIIDHHQDEGCYLAAQPRIIEPAGSTASLVCLEIIKENKVLLDERLAVLLLATILLDTVNLDPTAGRVSRWDEEAVKILQPFFPGDQEHFYSRIREEKFNVAALTSADLLRRDYKEWQWGLLTCGICSLFISIGQWQRQDPDVAGAVAVFAKSRGVELLLVMNAYLDGGFRRELMIYAAHRQLQDKVLCALQDNGLELTGIGSTPVSVDRAVISWFKQGNTTFSRKKVQPILARLFSSPGRMLSFASPACGPVR